MEPRAIFNRLAAAGVRLARSGDNLLAIPRDHLNDELRSLIRDHKAELLEALEPLSDPSAEKRRQKVLELLHTNPGVTYVLATDDRSDPEAVLLTFGLRDRATCEFVIPKHCYDPFVLLTLLERHGGTLH